MPTDLAVAWTVPDAASRMASYRRVGANRGRLAALCLAVILYTVASMATQHLGSAASKAATASTACSRILLEAPTCRPPLVVLLTTHKTGTAQAGCIKGEVVRALDLWRSDRYENVAATAHAVSDFAAGPFAAAEGQPTCPPAAVYTAGDFLPHLEDAHCTRHVHCPCNADSDGIARCLSMEPGTLDIPSGNTTTVVQVIRNPIDVVLSAYLYHTQVPAPEEWIESMKVDVYVGMWVQEGVIPGALRRIVNWTVADGLAGALPNETYGSFLRRLPPERGVRLEFWRSARSVYGAARQFSSLSQPGQGFKFLPVRFEDLQEDFNTAAGAMLAAFAERMPALDVPSLLAGPVQQCNPAAWSPGAQQAQASHVTAGRDPEYRSRLRTALLADAGIAARLCKLSAALGYEAAPECGSTNARH